MTQREAVSSRVPFGHGNHSPNEVTEKGKAIEHSNGVKFLEQENGCAVIEVLSGQYQFVSRL